MTSAKSKIYHAEKAADGLSTAGHPSGLVRFFLVLSVIFVLTHSSFTVIRNCLDGLSSPITSLEKRRPFIPPASHGLKTSFVSIDGKSGYSWFAADKVCCAVLPIDRVVVGAVLKTFDSDDPPVSFLVLPLRI